MATRRSYNTPRGFESSKENRTSRASMAATKKGVAAVRAKNAADRSARGKASKADPYKPKAGAARAARNASKMDVVPGRAGVKTEGKVSTRIRSAEWAMRDAQHRANNRAKARKNPTGRIGKALAKKGYNAANAAESESVKKRTQAPGKKYVPPRRGGGSKAR